MLKGIAKALGPSKDMVAGEPEPPASPAAGSSPTSRGQGRRVQVEPVAGPAAATPPPTAARPPRPPLSPFDAPAAGGSPCSSPRLSRASVKTYLCRDEVQTQMSPELQQRVSQQLARASASPQVVASAKSTLRREAAEVHCLPKVSSEELLPQVGAERCLGWRPRRTLPAAESHAAQDLACSLTLDAMPWPCPQLECVLSFGAEACECAAAEGGGPRGEETEGLREVGIEPRPGQPALPALGEGRPGA